MSWLQHSGSAQVIPKVSRRQQHQETCKKYSLVVPLWIYSLRNSRSCAQPSSQMLWHPLSNCSPCITIFFFCDQLGQIHTRGFLFCFIYVFFLCLLLTKMARLTCFENEMTGSLARAGRAQRLTYIRTKGTGTSSAISRLQRIPSLLQSHQD